MATTENEILLWVFLAIAALAILGFAILIIVSFCSEDGRKKMAGFLLEMPGKGGDPGKPSISRLQMIIWNFVIACAFLHILASSGLEPTTMVISGADGKTTVTITKLQAALDALFRWEILVLLGISNFTYVISKKTSQDPTTPSNSAPNNDIAKNLANIPSSTTPTAPKPMG
tara:strand:- start:43 stop:558 length:516 start_codon:yes stop_codon:yes gene_type:complete